MIIRKMEASDLSLVAEVDAKSFGKVFNLDESEITLNTRTIDSLSAVLIENPNGQFVAMDSNKTIVGYIFTHVWGSLGWIGTFSVNPAYQKFGFGKDLLNTAMKFLEGKNCTTIALETMPNSQSNIGLYIKYGFLPEYLTLIFKIKLIKQPKFNKLELIKFNSLAIQNKKDELISTIKYISSSIWEGLDYTNFIISTVEKNQCFLLFIKTTKIIGLVLIRDKSKNKRNIMENAVLEIFVLENKFNKLFNDSLTNLEQYLFEMGFKTLSLPINSFYSMITKNVIERGYKIEKTRLRMCLKKTDHSSINVNLCSFAM